MNFQKYDHKTKKKLISDYKKTISIYSSNNKKLLSQIKDLKTNLYLNQDLLYRFILEKLGENENIKNLINKSKTLTEKNESLIDKKIDIEIKTDLIKQYIEQLPSKIKEEISNVSIQNNKKKNELLQKDNTIKKLKLELEKVRKGSFFKTARTEVYVINPTKTSLEINQEIINAKSILSKVSNRHSKEKKKSDKLEREVKNLRETMDTLKQKAINLNNNNLNIINSKITENVKSIIDDNNFLVNMGYNIAMDKNDKDDEYEEEEKEDEDSSENDNSEGNGKITKAKEKEYTNLKDQYNKLKEIFELNQHKINEYKNINKQLKEKIEQKLNKNVNNTDA